MEKNPQKLNKEKSTKRAFVSLIAALASFNRSTKLTREENNTWKINGL